MNHLVCVFCFRGCAACVPTCVTMWSFRLRPAFTGELFNKDKTNGGQARRSERGSDGCKAPYCQLEGRTHTHTIIGEIDLSVSLWLELKGSTGSLCFCPINQIPCINESVREGRFGCLYQHNVDS